MYVNNVMLSQVQKRQIAVEELKSRYKTVLNENKKITENKCLEADKVSFSVVKNVSNNSVEHRFFTFL